MMIVKSLQQSVEYEQTSMVRSMLTQKTSTVRWDMHGVRSLLPVQLYALSLDYRLAALLHSRGSFDGPRLVYLRYVLDIAWIGVLVHPSWMLAYGLEP